MGHPPHRRFSLLYPVEKKKSNKIALQSKDWRAIFAACFRSGPVFIDGDAGLVKNFAALLGKKYPEYLTNFNVF